MTRDRPCTVTGVRRINGGVSRFGVVVGVCAVLLAGCSEAAGEAPVGLATPTVSAAPTPTPSPSPTALGPVDRSNPELGIVFTSLPSVPEDTPEAADLRAAIDTFTGFEQEFWRTLTEFKMALPIPGLASEAVVAYVQLQLDSGDERAVGTESVSVALVSSDPGTVVLHVCRDFTQVLMVSPDGSERALGAGALWGTAVTLGRDARGEWIVTGYQNDDPC